MSDPTELRSLLTAAEAAAGTGDFEAAERLLRDALAAQEAILGRLHPDLVETLNNLAVSCERQEKLADAERGYRRAHAIAVASLKPGDPVIAASLKNLVDFCESHGIALWAPPSAKPAAGKPGEAAPLAPAPSALFTSEAPHAPMEPAPTEPFISERDERAESAARAPGRLAAAVVLGLVVLLALWWVGPWREQVEPIDDAPSAAQAAPPSSPAPAVPPPTPSVPVPAPPKEERTVAPPRPNPREDPGRVEGDRPRAAATPQIEALMARVCTDFERRGTPDWQCTAISGAASPGVFTFYTRVSSKSSTTVEHRWYYRDRLHMRRSLSVSGGNTAGYRTYSRTTIASERAGDWRVELRASDGTLLQEERFVVR